MLRRALVIVLSLLSSTALAESGSVVNIHVEPGAAFPLADPNQTPVGQGVSLKVDVPVWKGLAIQGTGDAISFRSGPFLSPGTGIGAGAGLRYRILDDKQGYLLHMGDNAEGHQGNLFGNLWVDAGVTFLGGAGQVNPAFNAGVGAELSLLDNLQLGPFVKYVYAGPENILLAGLSLSIGIPDTSVHETDWDKDGIVNDKDKCPRDPEDKDGFQDEDGCPDKDNDGDGLLDAQDKCPNDAEDKDGFQDEDGCPDDDNDQDGVKDAADKCVNVAEDKDGFQDDDGCPEDDNDQDGIKDADDKCPNAAEDKDGFQDEDGCPDPDNDQDGIADGQDKCPNEPETRNGVDDEDGCPEKQAKVFVEQHKVVITEKIFFQFNKAKILPKSFGLLDSVAQVLQKFPEIKKVQIEGHTDDVGSPDYNQKLSEQRAQAVRDYLVQKGVAKERLDAVGFGKAKPLAEGKDEASREKNRRVEFTITDPSDGVVPVVVTPEETGAQPSDQTPSGGVDGGTSAPVEQTRPEAETAAPDAGAPDAGTP